jgi:Eukaryotic phosphomannomutase
MSQETLDTLLALRKKMVIGFVGGSDLVKITEQLQVGGHNGMCSSSNRWLHGLRRFSCGRL